MFTPYLEPYFVRGLEVSNLSNVSAIGSIVQKQNANKKKIKYTSIVYYIFKEPHNNLNDYKFHSFYIFTQISV